MVETEMKRLTVLTVCLWVSMTTVQGEEEALLISPPEVAVQPLEKAEFVCEHTHTEHPLALKWLRYNGTEEMILDKPRVQDANGTLTIENATVLDAGEYMCMTFNNSLNATAVLKVYTMPDYFMEGMIIVGINVALVLVFILCSISTIIHNKRAKRKKKRYQKAATS